MKKTITIILLIFIFHITYSQSDDILLNKYRKMALEYNHDLKSAKKNIAASLELVKSAKDDMKPSLEGNANFTYIGKPMELSINIPSIEQAISFKGQPLEYGVGLSIYQPLYSGGKIIASIKLSEQEHSLSENTFNLIRSNVCLQIDVQYWSAVASIELEKIFESHYKSTQHLKKIVQERVEVGLSDSQDLLMVEVKLNNSKYQLLKSQSETQTNRMALNSLIGNSLDTIIEIEQTIPIDINSNTPSSTNNNERPEILMAYNDIDIQWSLMQINDSQYKTKIYLGAEGSYSSPGYNFKKDLNLNGALFAKLSVPIFNWGKRHSDKQAYTLRANMAQDNLNKVKDEVALEIQKSKMNLAESLKRVELSNNSLKKAEENEKKAMERYNEGKVSITEVIDAQVYKLTAQLNFVQAKLAMQVNYSELLKATNVYNEDNYL